jgi:hypothetical protein
MNRDSQQPGGRFDHFDPLHGIHMSTRDRETARAAMQHADWITGLLMQTVEDLQSLAAAVARLWQRGPRQSGHMLAKPQSR